MTTVLATEIPEQSALRPWLEGSDFHDAYEAPLQDLALSPTEIFLRAARATPRWVADLMTIRNRIVIWFGIRDVGGFDPRSLKAAGDYRPGDRIGIFNVFFISENELVLGIDDSHLDVRVSVVKQARTYVVSTIVHVHNWVGRFYMAPVERIHPLIVRTMMRHATV